MIYAIRHGETDWNVEGRIQGGGSDTELNRNGILQAKALAEKLKDKGITKIYSSDLLRAKQTTNELNNVLNVDIIYSDLLRETNYGVVEGKKSNEIDLISEYNMICKAVDSGDNDAHFPGGESRNMVVRRFMDFLSTLNDSENILISTHGGILRSFSCFFGGPDKKIPNTGGISFLLKEGQPKDIVFFE